MSPYVMGHTERNTHLHNIKDMYITFERSTYSTVVSTDTKQKNIKTDLLPVEIPIHSGTNRWALQMISNRRITDINSHTSSPSVLHRPENPTEAVLSDYMDIKSAALFHLSVLRISRGSTDFWITAESEINLMISVRILSVSKRVKRESVSARRASVSVIEDFIPRQICQFQGCVRTKSTKR